MKIKDFRSKIIKTFSFIVVLLLFCYFGYSYAEDTLNEIYLEDDGTIYEVNLDDSDYIETLREDLDNAEEKVYKQESQIEELKEKLQTIEMDHKNEVQNLWVCFIFILLIAVYISYQVGLDKN